MQSCHWHWKEPLAQAALPPFAAPVPGRQAGARIRPPPPLPPRVHVAAANTADYKQNSGLYVW